VKKTVAVEQACDRIQCRVASEGAGGARRSRRGCEGRAARSASASAWGVLAELMEEEVAEVVGPKGRHDPDRAAVRHGHEVGEITLGGRRVGVKRPRVRSADGDREVPLASYAHYVAVVGVAGVRGPDTGLACRADGPPPRRCSAGGDHARRLELKGPHEHRCARCHDGGCEGAARVMGRLH
jgi:hypothetical protein